MANARNGNTWYVDSATASGSDLTGSSIKVVHIILTGGASAGSITLADASSTAPVKATLKVAAGTSQEFRLSDAPMTFPAGIRISAISNLTATLITRESST